MIIKTAAFVCSSSNSSQCPKDNLPEVAFIGRSNVGKSSLINMLANNKNLCKTSSTPGKTKLINHYLINNNLYFVDLPGYGYAKVSKKERNILEMMITSFIVNNTKLKQLYVLVDSRHEPMNIDLVFLENICDKKIPFSLVLTKCDKLTAALRNKHIKMFVDSLASLNPNFKFNIIQTSSEKKMGKEELLNNIFDNTLKL